MAQETIQCLRLGMLEQHVKGRQGGCMTKLTLQKVVQELLREPVHDAQTDHVGLLTIMQMETQLQM